MKIAIIQTGCWGDNINSTLMLYPIKQAYQNCIIDIHTSTLYSSAFYNNPYVDNIIQYQASNKNDALHLTTIIPGQLTGCGYNMSFSPHPMFNHGNWNSIKHPELGDNLICAWIRALEHANIEYQWPLETILKLTDEEVARAHKFLTKLNMSKFTNLVENGPESGQNYATIGDMFNIMDTLCSLGQNVIASRASDGADFQKLKLKHGDLFHHANITLRECAEIFNRCNRYIGQSSGLNNACNTNWCRKDVEWIEIINSPTVSSAPIRSSGKLFWTPDKGSISELIDVLRK